MLDLKTVTHETFVPCLKQLFTLDGEPAVSLELFEVAARGSFDPARQSRAPFSVIFLGPSESALTQGLYRLHNSVLGTLELFLVPIAQDATGIHYEAVFT